MIERIAHKLYSCAVGRMQTGIGVLSENDIEKSLGYTQQVVRYNQ
jgi:hypothetical protein